MPIYSYQYISIYQTIDQEILEWLKLANTQNRNRNLSRNLSMNRSDSPLLNFKLLNNHHLNRNNVLLRLNPISLPLTPVANLAQF